MSNQSLDVEELVEDEDDNTVDDDSDDKDALEDDCMIDTGKGPVSTSTCGGLDKLASVIFPAMKLHQK